MPLPYYIGLDVGTTATKAVAFSPDGVFLDLREAAYALHHPEPGAAVQNPEDVLTAAGQALAELVESRGTQPLGVTLSCPMHSVLLCSADGSPVTDVITWADTRAQAVMPDFTEDQCHDLHRATGTPVHPMSPLVKLRWLLRQQPEMVGKATYCYDLKSYLTLRWAGQATLDEQLASATGLYDAAAGDWYQPALQMVANGEFPFTLPPVQPADHQLRWKQDVADRLGLTGVPLFLGGSDGVLANLGSDILEPGAFALSVGTSAAVRTTHSANRIDPAHGLFNYKLSGNRYVVGGPSNNGGKVLAYWQHLLSAHYPDVGAFIDGALSVSTDDLPAFKPYLYGERAPLWDAAATGQLTNLRGHHGPAHLAAAVLHGVTDNIVALIRQLEAAVGPAKVIRVTGGITKSPEWLDLLAKKCARPVEETDQSRATAWGAVRIALGGGEG